MNGMNLSFGSSLSDCLRILCQFLTKQNQSLSHLTCNFFRSLNKLQAIVSNSDWSGTYFGADIIRQLFENHGIKGVFPLASTKRLLTSSRGTLEFNCHLMLTMIPKVQSSLAVTAWVFWLYACVADIIKFDATLLSVPLALCFAISLFHCC